MIGPSCPCNGCVCFTKRQSKGWTSEDVVHIDVMVILNDWLTEHIDNVFNQPLA